MLWYHSALPYLFLHRFCHRAGCTDKVSGLRRADIKAQLLSADKGVESATIADVNHHLPMTRDVDGQVWAEKRKAVRRGNSAEQWLTGRAREPVCMLGGDGDNNLSAPMPEWDAMPYTIPDGLIQPLRDNGIGEGFARRPLAKLPAPTLAQPPPPPPLKVVWQAQSPPVAAAKAGTLWKRTGLLLRWPSQGTKAVMGPQGQRRRTAVSGQLGAATSP